MKVHWTVPQMWKGGECWIIGGGASMPRQFGIPEDAIQNVESKQDPISIYSEYLKPLHDRHIIGANIAFMLGDWVDVLYFCDRNFFRVHQDQIQEFPNIKATCVSTLTQAFPCHRIKRLKRDMAYGLTPKRDAIRWNGNSGAAAINFAAHTGVKRILLLGFDMHDQHGRSHWHEGFPQYTKKTDPHNYKRFLRGFPAIALEAKKRGIEILNVNPDSKLGVFEKVKLKDVI